MKKRLVAGAAMVSLLLAACGSGSGLRPSYLAKENDGAIFLQLQRQHSHVSGTLAASFFDASNPTQLQARSETVQGTITGSQLQLALNGETTWTGKISGSTLTVSYTASDGSIKTVNFHAASASDYDAAVAATKADIARATKRQNARQAVDSAASSLSSADQSLQEDTSTLNDDSFGSDTSAIQGDVQTVQGDLQTVRSDSRDVACNDAGVASNDAGVAANDLGVLHNDVQVDAGDAGRVRADMASVLSDYHDLVAASNAAPGYAPPNVPDAVAVGADVRQGKAAIRAERTRVAAAEARGAALVAQAHAIAAQAHSVGCG